MNVRAKRVECVQLAGAVGRWGWSESGSKLRALQTLRAATTDARPQCPGIPRGTSLLQARCWPVASRLLACCLRILFVFSSYFLRILLVFSSCFPLAHPSGLRQPSGASTEPRLGFDSVLIVI